MLDNIPIFRAKKIDSEDYVEGFLTRSRCYSGVYILPSNYTQDEDIEGYEEEIVEIDPTTIAIHFPDMLDSQSNKIFASLQEDGKGGDLVSMGKGCINRTLVYKYGQFWFTDFSNNQLNSSTFNQVAFNLHFTEKFNSKNKLRSYLNDIEVIGIQQ